MVKKLKQGAANALHTAGSGAAKAAAAPAKDTEGRILGVRYECAALYPLFTVIFWMRWHQVIFHCTPMLCMYVRFSNAPLLAHPPPEKNRV